MNFRGRLFFGVSLLSVSLAVSAAEAAPGSGLLNGLNRLADALARGGITPPRAGAGLATTQFIAVSAGDVTDAASILWTQLGYINGALQTAAPAELVRVEVATDAAFATIVFTGSANSVPDNGNTVKFLVNGLSPNTQYYYRFSVTHNGVAQKSETGKFRTNPAANAQSPFSIAFSGDYNAKYRPYALMNKFGEQGGSVGLNYYINLGDIIYETAATGSAALPGAKGAPEPELTPYSPALTRADLNRFYLKYIEGITGVQPLTGSPSVSPLLQQGAKRMLASQSVYTLLDNHELYNAMISGGAPLYSGKENYRIGETDPAFQPKATEECYTAAGPTPATPSPSGKKWVSCLADAGSNTGANASFVNRSNSFGAMIKAFYNTQGTAVNINGAPGALTPLNLLGATPTIQAPNDPRTHGTVQNYFSRSWGAGVRYFQLDDRSYRDARMYNVSSVVANDPRRTMLGATQLAWFKQELLNAKNAGVKWKIVAISTPIDVWLDMDTGRLDNKSWVGGYNYERNDILKFIVDNGIKNVVFLTTDDHVSRTTKLQYQPAGASAGNPWVEAPNVIQILAGPAGADGPYQNAILNKRTNPPPPDFSIRTSEAIILEKEPGIKANGGAGVGLVGYPGLSVLFREEDPTAATNPKPIDFFHATSFNYATLSWDANAAMTVAYWGVNAYPQNTYPAPCATGATTNCVQPPRKLLEFAITPAM